MNYKINFTDDMENWKGGECNYPKIPLLNLFGYGECKINIRKKYISDMGIIEHEITHAKQYKNNMFHILKYKFSKDYRLKCELEAYTQQIKYYGYKDIKQCSWIAKALVDKYDLDIDFDEAIEHLKTILKDLNK